MPMLALINFIITLFGTESLSTTLTQEGGLSFNNKALMTERTNNLVIAAQFLGTMTPLLTWGLVRGAMAFTEFISHGIGSSFATQAGAVAATGNFSTNNLSMDNASMNKYNTAMASTVGTQATNAFTNAGSLVNSADRGGANVFSGGSMVSAQKQASEALSQGISQSEAVSRQISDSMSKSASLEEAYAHARSSGNSAASEQAAARILQSAKAAAQGEGAGSSMSVEQRQNLQRQVNAMEATRTEQAVKADAGFGLPGGLPIKAGASTSASGARSQSNDAGASSSSGHGGGSTSSADRKVSVSDTSSDGSSATTSSRAGSSASDDRTASQRMSASEQSVMQDALSTQESVTRSLSATKSVVDSFGVNSDMDLATVNQRIESINGMQSGMTSDVAGIEAKASALGDQLTGRHGATQGLIDQYRGQSRGGMSSLGPSGGAPAGFAAIQADASSAIASRDREVSNRQSQVEGEYAGLAATASANIKSGDVDANALGGRVRSNGERTAHPIDKLGFDAIRKK
jgi:hypothetical protein